MPDKKAWGKITDRSSEPPTKQSTKPPRNNRKKLLLTLHLVGVSRQSVRRRGQQGRGSFHLLVVHAVESLRNQKKEQWLTLQANSLPLLWWKSGYFFYCFYNVWLKYQSLPAPAEETHEVSASVKETQRHKPCSSCSSVCLSGGAECLPSAGTGWPGTLQLGQVWFDAFHLSAAVSQLHLTDCLTCCHKQRI